MKTLQLAIVRGASLLVPDAQREDWLAEWTSELWYVRPHGEWKATCFCLGAFADAVWLRRHPSNTGYSRKSWLESPALCLSLLAVLAISSALVAFRLPPIQEILSPPAPPTGKLVTISSGGFFAPQFPTVPIAKYRSLKNATRHLFVDSAFYSPISSRVKTPQGKTEGLSIFLASRNLFKVLNVPLPVRDSDRVLPTLILEDQTWRRYFAADSEIIGQTINVDGEKALVGAVLSANSWRVPGKADAWLLVDDERLAAIPPPAIGFVAAHLKTPPDQSQQALRWRILVPNDVGGNDSFQCVSPASNQLVVAHILMLVLSVLILPATTSLRLGDYTANRNARPLSMRLRRWIFLGLKIVLLLVIVFCGTLDLASVTSTQIQPHALLVGYVLALRWALSDQRERCPVCLRLVSSPTHIGSSSQTFLEWYGTELVCAKGHGLLHVPTIPSSYSTQRWLYLDQSWAGLFSPRKITTP